MYSSINIGICESVDGVTLAQATIGNILETTPLCILTAPCGTLPLQGQEVIGNMGRWVK